MQPCDPPFDNSFENHPVSLYFSFSTKQCDFDDWSSRSMAEGGCTAGIKRGEEGGLYRCTSSPNTSLSSDSLPGHKIF